MQKLTMILLWALASAAVIVLITLPISLQTQLDRRHCPCWRQ